MRAKIATLSFTLLLACPGEPVGGDTGSINTSTGEAAGSASVGPDGTSGGGADPGDGSSTGSGSSTSANDPVATTTGPGGCEGGGPHDYFDCLSERDDVFESRSYRTQEMIDEDVGGDPDPSRLGYDSDVDAARFSFAPGVGNARQLRAQHEGVSSGNLLYHWEARWGAGWATDGSVQGINTHKAFQLSTWCCSGGGGLYLELKVG